MKSAERDSRGFTLVEMLVGMALGLVVLSAAVMLFAKALDATYAVSQSAELQQNARAALDQIARDVSLAGYGVATGGVQLPTGGTGNSIYGCDGTTCYVGGQPPTGVAYPTVAAYQSNPAVVNHLYGIIPGSNLGMAIVNRGIATDLLTMAYVDSTFRLDLYTVTGFGNNGTSMTLTAPYPQPTPPVPALNDAVYGLKAGDLVLLSNSNGSAIGEVSNATATVISFGDNDWLRINQSNATAGNIKTFIQNLPPGAVTLATRLLVITYYIDVPRGPDNVLYTADDGPPRLMRQISGQSPMPIAENITDLQFTYDVFDENTGTAQSGLRDAGLGQVPPLSPNQIRKVNLFVAARSPLQNRGGYQGLQLRTSVSARNLSFRDRYQ